MDEFIVGMLLGAVGAYVVMDKVAAQKKLKEAAANDKPK